MLKAIAVVCSLTLVLLAQVEEVRSACLAAATCYGEDCDYWVTMNGAVCSELENSGCDCSECDCGSSSSNTDDCPATCFGDTCDTWTEQGTSCEDLEAKYQCVCGGCTCDPPVTEAPSTAAGSTTEPGSTTTTERIFSAASDAKPYTGTIPLGITHTTTTHADCPPGHICQTFGAPTTKPVKTTDSGGCKADLSDDGYCDDDNNNEACGWDEGDCCGVQVMDAYCETCGCLDPAMAPFYNCNGTCTHPEWDGDGFCDDANNNCVCNWDGGDCCGSDNSYKFCSDCLCLDVAYQDETCHKGCAHLAWSGDDFCDDANNNCGCDWDGGDCCGANKHTTYCTECACLDPDNQMGGDHASCILSCENLAHYGDGFCDDNNNVCGCDWDGGDCCGGEVNFRYCIDCNCLDPDFQCPGDGKCDNAQWVNDQFCDDGNNNCGCNWDHGDCCGNDKHYNYCTECECKDRAYLAQGCTGICGVSIHKNDGYCDDANNNCGCDWDGGDCCGQLTEAHKIYCTECACLDPNHAAMNCTSVCETPGYKGDGHCDDGNNVCGCAWDGGDCCAFDSTAYEYCDDCTCLDPDSPKFGTLACASVCANPGLDSDGFCNDQNNICGCNWDGGDCCGTEVNEKYCNDCQCLDPAFTS